MDIFEKLYKNLLLSDILATKYLNNYFLDYIIFVVFFVLLYIFFAGVIRTGTQFIVKLVSKKSKDDKFTAACSDYVKSGLRSKITPLGIIAAFFIAINFLILTEKVELKVNTIIMILAAFFSTRLCVDIVKFYIIAKSPIAVNTGKPSGALYLLLPIIKIFIWIVVFFFVISNLGYNINALITGVGVGGVAIALASQSFLSDILSYVSIISDKPFELGDYISVSGSEGNVTKIGIKSVRILSYTGEEIVIPNAAITSSKLQNFRKMNRRRVDLEFQLTLDTSNNKLEKVPEILKNIVEEKKEELEFGRSHLSGFSTFGYIFKTVYYVLGNDYLKYMNLQQYVNLRLRQELQKIEAQLACPKKDIKLLTQEDDF